MVRGEWCEYIDGVSKTCPSTITTTATPRRICSSTTVYRHSMLSSLVRLPPPPTDADIPVEDIFSSALGLIFTDDLRNQHGDPGSSVTYKSKSYGDIELRLTDPAGEDSRKLFSQYLWNAGVQMAEYLGEERGRWSVEGQKVLELGAGR